jgi:hypothetical protein
MNPKTGYADGHPAHATPRRLRGEHGGERAGCRLRAATFITVKPFKNRNGTSYLIHGTLLNYTRNVTQYNFVVALN